MGLVVKEKVVGPPEWRPWELVSRQDGIDCQAANDGRTKQAFKDEADINKMIARFDRTGLLDNVNVKQGVYADVSELRDYKSALDVVSSANSLFAELPALIRERFENDPAQLIEFLDDPKNVDEAVELGLVVKREESVTPPVEPALPAPAAAAVPPAAPAVPS